MVFDEASPFAVMWPRSHGRSTADSRQREHVLQGASRSVLGKPHVLEVCLIRRQVLPDAGGMPLDTDFLDQFTVLI